MPREGYQRGLVLARQCPGSPGTCNPEEVDLPGLPLSSSSTLFSGSRPVGLLPVPLTEKTIERSPFFVRRGGHFCRGDLVGRTTFWIVFKWLAKVRAMYLEVYWASWGVCWLNADFGRCSLFPSRSGYGLISTVVLNRKVHYPIHKCPPPVPILSQTAPARTPTSYFMKMHLNIILKCTPASPKWSVSLRFPHEISVYTSALPQTCYISRPPHSGFDHTKNIERGV